MQFNARRGLITIAAVGAAATTTAVAIGAELVAAELVGTTNQVSVQSGASQGFTINLSATGRAACGSTHDATVHTVYNVSSAGVVTSNTMSDRVHFSASGTGENCPVTGSGTVPATVNVASGTPAGTYTVTLQESRGNVVTNSSNSSGGKLDDTDATVLTFDVSAAAQAVNQAPSAPGAPQLASGSASPNTGVFGLTWTASTDDGLPANSSVGYRLEHRDADDATYSVVGGALSTNAFAFAAPAEEAEGTWTYRVRATDGTLNSDYSPASSAIKVDRSAPNAPTAAPDRTPEYTSPSGAKWWNGDVTVTFSDTGDATLADGSAGSGVDAGTIAAPETLTSSGTASDTVSDVVGNESAAGSLTVNIDRIAPSVVAATNGCPTGPVIVGTPVSVNWTATDGGSGLATAASGTATGQSAVLGENKVYAPAGTARDNVGNESTRTELCTFTATYRFDGFLAPINGDAVNAGKTGRAYPVKWQLKDASGALISDAEGQRLASLMKATQQGASGCTAQMSDPIDYEAAGATALRYDDASDQFILNYKAPSTAGCYRLTIEKADGGGARTLTFSFTR